jgi:hypothetical protein
MCPRPPHQQRAQEQLLLVLLPLVLPLVVLLLLLVILMVLGWCSVTQHSSTASNSHRPS